MNDSDAIDVPVIQLRPLRDRKVTKREYERILASIKSVGLIEPLVVFPENGDYLILDGVQRYRALVELGVDTAPCIMGKQREAPFVTGSPTAEEQRSLDTLGYVVLLDVLTR